MNLQRASIGRILPPFVAQAGLLMLAILVWPAIALSLQEKPALGSFAVETVSGESFSGTGIRIADGRVHLDGETPREFGLDELVLIETGVTAARPTAGQRILFVTGGGLRAEVAGVSASGLDFSFRERSLSVALDVIAGIIWTDSPEVRSMLENPSAEADRIVAQGSDSIGTVSGLFEGMNDTQLTIQFQGQRRTVDRDKILAIFPARIAVPTKADVSASITLADGESFRGRVIAMDQEMIQVAIMQQELQLPAGSVTTIAIASDRIQRLSELEPVELSEQVLFAPGLGWKRNSSVSGNPIRLRDGIGSAGGGTFRNGLGMQARTQMVFANDGGFDRFAALVGIDLETEGRGDCLVSVRGDGIALWSAHLTGKDPAIPVNVDISGMQRIELIVEPGKQLDLADHVDWADARFLRTK